MHAADAAKRLYSSSARALAGVPPLERFLAEAEAADAYGWRRWLASLLAIHQPQRMIRLDCPWWHVAATREVVRFLAARPGARVFEFGSGASTAWLARRAGEVISVEHHADWHRLLAPLVAGFANVALWHRPLEGEGYPGAIAEAGEQFDLIVVDGRRRIDCLTQALPHLKPGGIVLFDDSGRSRYRAGIAGCGLRERHFFGRSYCVPYPDHSSILHG
ncbi:class I SAM-dependent methyltransferase [Novosphingobium sp.]|jgi:protein-L-isoaspartate O-methyltransferase|uniref:class I SAM-dependent methyltransferase n=1 Tax=Novosphingobium sp. TaxID=1874826 RepID=UPI0022C77585|nr:class I SAM-dependent methyltransferase [Novosphingobium sp.]MCZ8019653.1 class I SAM-dependent methyltransferase [Novosphingobium sp.]MCZ8035468.1 class I SAM-dependent methyltransferase [Novosphingobium sp.]MCZ8050782.1 class I SAM-dependent methyltransferase [Novosphingobium sp.]MCZ8059128.1 class I SAM-dependent methyltransferase [Novosphingobium sp.]MCZ8232574.1 class I SAM-dependent methyltransferase [Novosphingobium sp.]